MSNIDLIIEENNVGVNIEETSVSTVIEETPVVIRTTNDSISVSVSGSGPQGPRGTQVLVGTTDPSPIVGLVGDLYINTSTGFIFGPKEELGWPAGVAIGGETGGVPATAFGHTHYQTIPDSVWTIEHSLVFNPNAIFIDFNGNVIEGECQYNGNVVTATFSESITGVAYLS